MLNFGPTVNYNTERCESFNGIVRRFNVHGDRQAPSQDIAGTFSTISTISHLSMGQVDVTGRQTGKGLSDLLATTQVQHLLFGTPMPSLVAKSIYKHGALKKVQSQRAIKVGDVAVKLAGRTSKLKDHLSLASLNFESLCLCGDAFYCAEQSKLVHIGSYVKFKDLTGTEQYGTMAAVFCCNGDTTAVLAPFLPLGMGEMDCPKFVMGLCF